VSIRSATKQFSWFLVVGGVSTACHFLTLWVLREFAGLGVVVATTIGYMVGAIVNYILNKRVTFANVTVGMDAVPRFSVVVLTGLTLNGFLMASMEYAISWVPYLLRQCVATAVTLLSNFYLHRQWTFRVRNTGESR